MRIRSFIFTALSLLLISCAKADQENTDIFSVIKGRVTDADENPIEHMEVTIEISKRTAQKTVYTSSDGTFMIDINNREARQMKSLTITLKDIDGEENGGLFETKTEEIFIYEEDLAELPVILDLDFRCSLAIP